MLRHIINNDIIFIKYGIRSSWNKQDYNGNTSKN